MRLSATLPVYRPRKEIRKPLGRFGRRESRVAPHRSGEMNNGRYQDVGSALGEIVDLCVPFATAPCQCVLRAIFHGLV